LLGAAMREALPHDALLHTRTLQRQGLLRRHAQSLVVARFRIAHSISSAALSSPATAASIAGSSGVPPRYRSSATMRFRTAFPASPARTAACITFVAPNAKLKSASGKSL